MTNEATLIFETSVPIPFTVSNSAGIEKGKPCTMTDPMTAAAVGATELDPVLAGIAATEKIASDGVTKLGMYRKGIFKMTCSGAIPVGLAVSIYNGLVYCSPVTTSGCAILGHALETIGNGETGLIEVDIGSGGNHIS